MTELEPNRATADDERYGRLCANCRRKVASYGPFCADCDISWGKGRL